MLEKLAARDALEKVPPVIRDAPELELGLGLYYGAFWDLNSCRSVGMGEGPIPWLAIDAYATARALDEEQRADLHHHVLEMDRAYLKHQAEQSEKGRKRADKPQPKQFHAANPKGGGGRRARGR